MSIPRKQKYGLGYEEILDEIRSGSARVAAILAGVFVHDILQVAIKYNMVPMAKNEETAIFDGNGPLSTFSSCIKIGYAMGLYRVNMRHDMNQIKDIRNEYAHTLHSADLGESELRARILALKSVADISDIKDLPSNHLMAEAVQKITSFLIMRTTPYNLSADQDAISSLSSLEYTEDDEIKLRDIKKIQRYARG